jgi:hypothetical protein
MALTDVTQRKGFNGDGIIDLADFDSLPVKEQLNAKFLGFDFLDLDTVNKWTDDYKNIAIRDEKDNVRLDELSDSFYRQGFLTKYWPPCVGIDDNSPRDGRGRIRAALMNDERWIPVAKYRYDDRSERNYLTNGLIANNHDPSARATPQNFIDVGVTLISEGQLLCNKNDVVDWLYGEANVKHFWPNDTCKGVITRIIDTILVRGSKDGAPLTHRQDRPDWQEWVTDTLGYTKKDFWLCSADNVSYLFRAWCEKILPSVSKGISPVNIILYSNSYDPNKCRKNVRQCGDSLDTFYRQSFGLVNDSLKGVIEVKPSETRPYKILGCVPQIVGEHDLNGGLIPVDEY